MGCGYPWRLGTQFRQLLRAAITVKEPRPEGFRERKEPARFAAPLLGSFWEQRALFNTGEADAPMSLQGSSGPGST